MYRLYSFKLQPRWHSSRGQLSQRLRKSKHGLEEILIFKIFVNVARLSNATFVRLEQQCCSRRMEMTSAEVEITRSLHHCYIIQSIQSTISSKHTKYAPKYKNYGKSSPKPKIGQKLTNRRNTEIRDQSARRNMQNRTKQLKNPDQNMRKHPTSDQHSRNRASVAKIRVKTHKILSKT